MERRIKLLYIITIFAILAFLGMQGYWLYSRYEYSMSECEDQTQAELLAVFDEYNEQRVARKGEKSNSDVISHSSMSMSLTRDDSTGISRKVGIRMTTFRYTAQEILGLPADHVLTPEEKNIASKKILELATEGEITGESNDFDASEAPTDGAVWEATKNLEIEKTVPFTKEGIDSVLRNADMDVRTSLAAADLVVWLPVLDRHKSAMSPSIRLTVPYSELEKKVVVFECPIRVSDVLSKMFDTLIVVGTLSLLLIICLIGQFSTILKQNRLEKMRNNFVMTMIHELKRPISTLKMCVSGINTPSMMSEDETREHILSETRRALNNLSAYFSKLRDITFNSVDQVPLNHSQFSMRQLVKEAAGSVAIPSGKSVEIKDVSAADVLLTADRMHTLNMLINLLENAIKYSGEDTRINIEYSASQVDGEVTIRVSDNGIGMSAADCRRVFDRFYRCRTAVDSEQPGMGLGLAYVRLLVKAHGGDITVESREGEGSCFILKFPQ